METTQELQHWGIKGQKWGVRRYQNPDGTLTEEGKAHYMTAARKGKLDPKKLPDEDLDRINKRFEKESKYQQNVEKYQKGTMSYKIKEATIARLKGTVTGGGKGKGGGKGGGGIKSLLLTPITKAFTDAFNYQPPKTGNNKSDDDDNDEAREEWHRGMTFLNGSVKNKSVDDFASDDRINTGKNFLGTVSNREPEGPRFADWNPGNTTSFGVLRERGGYTVSRAENDAKNTSNKRKKKAKHSDDDGITFVVIRGESNELTHYGILGQKWGVRRFQNEDRTLTAAGKERYGQGSQGTKSGRTKDLVGESTNRESEYVNSCGVVSHDPKVRRQLDSIISNSRDPAVKNAVEHANEWKSSSDKLNNAFSTFSARLRKDRGGKEWDGDGTEEHWEMEKRYPEYRDISRNEQIALKKLVESSITLAKSKEFANVKGFENSKNYFDSYPEYGNWFKKGDQRAYAIAMTLLGGRDTKKYFEIWPEYFIESFDGSGNKIDTGMFETK